MSAEKLAHDAQGGTLTIKPWQNTTIKDVQKAIDGTIVGRMCNALCSPCDPALPLEVGLIKALPLAGTALCGKKAEGENTEGPPLSGSDLARVRIMTAGGQVPNFYALLVGKSASGKDVGGMAPKAASAIDCLIGDAGSEEGIMDAYVNSPSGLLNISEMLNWLDRRHWQHKAASFLTGIFNRGWFNVTLSKRSGAEPRSSNFCYPNIIASVQPGVIQEKAERIAMDSGFLGRFIIAQMPSDFMAYPCLGDNKSNNDDLVKCMNILQKKCGDVTPDNNRYNEPLNEMFLAGKAEFEATWKRLTGEYYPRFALLLSILEDDQSTDVKFTEDGWRRAEVLVRYFYSQAEIILGGLHFDTRQAELEKLCDKIYKCVERQPHKVCSKSKLSHTIGKGTKQVERDAAIAELIDRGKLTKLKSPTGGLMLKVA